MRRSFEGFEIDTESGQLFRAGREVPLERRASEMLCYLVSHPGRLITKEELLSEVWQAPALSNGVLSNAAAKLRTALGQPAGAREPLETVHGRGYRWHAAARPSHDSTASGSRQRSEPKADPFVGRASVLELLEGAIDQAAQGHGQLAMLAGDAGIGKTRTLDELATRARARGFSVWEGTCCDGGGAPPYWPWVEVLRAAQVDLSRALFRRHLAADSWAISLLVPELVGVPPANLSVDTEATRFRLFDEIARFVASTSCDGPRLIVVDDIHWADDETLELLSYLARTLRKRAVMLAVTLREHGTPERGARSEAMQRLRRQATYVRLHGLSHGEVEELVLGLEGKRPIDTQLSHALYQHSQGNPFFVRQFLALLAQRGQSLGGEDLALPPAVRDILRQRVAALGSEGRSVLELAAAVGTEFDAGLLADVLGRPLADVLAALEPARRKSIVVGQATPHRFAFAHALLRDALYDELDLVERGALHARLGQLLAQRPAGGDPRNLGEVARHYLLAVPPELDACVRHCRDAAAAARSALGFETAAELLSRACEKLSAEGGDEHIRCELSLDVALDRFHGGDFSDARGALERAAAIAERIGASDILARCACTLAAWLDLGGGNEQEARRLLARALEMVGERDPDSRARLLAARAQIHVELSADERCALLAEAEALAAQRNTPRIVLNVAACRTTLVDPARLEDTRRAIATYHALAQQRASALIAPERLAMNFTVESRAYLAALTACDLTAADGAIERIRQIAEESQLVAVTLGLELMRAARALGDGRLDDLEAILLRNSQRFGAGSPSALVWQYYAVRLIETRGDLTNLASHLGDLPKSVQELQPGQLANVALLRARMLVKVGAHDRARSVPASIPSEQLARMPARYGDLQTLCLLAEVHEGLGDRAGALALYPRLLPYAALNAVGPALDYGGSVEHYLGILAELLGRGAEAAQHFERAELVNRQLRMPLQLAQSASRRAAARALEGR